MDNGRNWQGWAALALAGLALFVALSGHLNFSFSLSDGADNAVVPAQAFRMEKGAISPNAVPGGADSSQQLQDMQQQLNDLKQKLGEQGQAIPAPVVPAVPQVPQIKIPVPDAPTAPQIQIGGHSTRKFSFGPFGGGFSPFTMLGRLLPLIGLGLLAWWFFFRRRRGGPVQAARRATTPLQPPTPPEGPTGAQS
jgi:hypothetical protein